MYSITMKCWPEALVQAGVEDLHDVGVDQARGRLRLALEARHERGVVGEVLGEQLDRHLALQAQVEREVDGGHPAEARAGPPGGSARRSPPRSSARLPCAAAAARCRAPRSFAASARAVASPAASTAVPPPAARPLAGPGLSFRSRERACRRPGWWPWGRGVVRRRGGRRFGVVVVVVGVVWVLVVVVGGWLVVVVVCGSGWAHSASARERRFAMPWPSVLRRPASTVGGQRGEVLFGLARSRLRWPCSCRRRSARPGRRLRSRSAAARRSRLGSGPCRSCRRRRAAAAATPSSARREAGAQDRSAMVRMVIDRTPGARRASPAGAPRGSRAAAPATS